MISTEGRMSGILSDGKAPSAFERLKLEIDAIKHLSTLSTGSILLIATFFDKIPKSPFYREGLAVSLMLLTASLGGCVAYLMTPWTGNRWRFEGFINRVLFVEAHTCFLLGIICLGKVAYSGLLNVQVNSK